MVGDGVGALVGEGVGALVGDGVGAGEGITTALQVSQHIRLTVSILHLFSVFFLATHGQPLRNPSPFSGISNGTIPPASPTHSLQHVSQQFNATSGRAHLVALSSSTAHSHVRSSVMSL